MSSPDPRLNLEFCGMHFASPLVLLSGCVGFGEEYTRVQGFSNRDCGAICLKGTTGSQRLGNQPHRVYETPGGTILLTARRAMESITLDRGAQHTKDEMMPRYAELVYNGFWFSPEREMLQAAIDASQTHVTGTVRIKLYKGLATCVGRWSDHSLYSEEHVTFEDDAGAYDQKDAAGFIQLNALRLKLLAARERRLKG